ncbi:MAG: proprotein convertase P-domain-containing protein [Armatimonadota bacterium]
MRSLYLIGILILNLVLGGLLALSGAPAQAQNSTFIQPRRIAYQVESLLDVVRRERSAPQRKAQPSGEPAPQHDLETNSPVLDEPVLQPRTVRRGPGAAAVSTPSPDAVFDTVFASGSPTPNPSVAVGPQHVVVTANKQLGIFTFDGSAAAQVLLTSFFPADISPDISEATVVWDPWINRFVLVARGFNDQTKLATFNIAVSSSSDPTGFWIKQTFIFQFLAPDNLTHKLSYPRIGFDQSNYYLGFNVLPFPGVNEPPTNLLLGISRNGLLSGGGNPRGIINFTLPPPFAPGTLPLCLTPVQAVSPTNQTMVLADAGGTGVMVFKIANFFGVPAFDDDLVATAPNEAGPFTAPQPGGSLSVGDYRVNEATYQDGRIWTGRTIRRGGSVTGAIYRIIPQPLGSDSTLEREFFPTASAGVLYQPSVQILPDPFNPGNRFGLAAFHGSGFGVAPTLFVSRYNPIEDSFGAAIPARTGASRYAGAGWGRTTDVALDTTSGGLKMWAVGESTIAPSEVTLLAARVNLRGVEVLSPNGNETYAPGQAVQIRWVPGGAGANGVTLRLSRDGGATYPEVIVANTTDDGVYDWVVPSPVTLNARVRVELADLASVNDQGDGNFTITDAASFTHCKDDEGAPVTPVAIPDNRSGHEWAEMDLFFPVDKIIHGFEVDVDITHPFIGDLEVELQHPDGTRILLHNETGAGDDNLVLSYPPTPIAEDVNEARAKLLRKRTVFFDSATGSPDPTRPWKLRVRDLKIGDIGQINNWCLTIIGPSTGELDITSPNGGERWDVGSSRKITWTNGPNSFVQGDVLVQLSRDGGATYTTLGQVPALNGEFDWTVTDPETTRARVKVVSVLEPVQLDVSAADFSILNPFIRVDRPSLNERVATGKNYVIRWDSVPDTDTVKIELSRDGGDSFTDLAASAPNTGTFNWTPVAGTDDTTRAVIRVSANGGPAREDTSDPFIIETPAIVVLTPDGGELWHTFHQKEIRWRTVGVEGEVRIEVSRLANRSDWTEIARVPASDGSFTWTVEGNPTTLAKVRVTSVSEPDKTDESDSSFEIRRMSVTLARPNGGESFGIGTAQGLAWTSDGVLGGIDLELSRDSGATWEPLFTNVTNSGAAIWGVSGPATAQALVRVKTHDYPVEDVSNAVFAIVPSAVTVLAPNGGEELRVGRTVDLRWVSSGFGSSVKIDLSRDGGTTWQTLFADAENDGVQPWVVTAPDTAQALIRITSTELSNVSDASDTAFTIVTPRVAVTAPNGAERWFTQTTQRITWTSQGIDTLGAEGNVRIELTRDGGTTWETLAASTPNDGFEDWVVAGNPTGNARIRVTALDVSGAVDESNGPFSIVSPAIVVTQPTTAAEVLIGTPLTISWTSSGVTGNVRIELTRDGGATWETLAADTENDGVELWSVSGEPSAQAFIRITPLDRQDVAGTSGEFAISRATLTVTAPTRRTKAAIGRQLVITWDGSVVRSGTGTVTIELSRNGGRTWKPIIVDTANDGVEVWIATGGATDKARVRVIWNADTSVRDDSDGNFRIGKAKAVKKNNRRK